MGRTSYCRQNIDKVAKECKLGDDIVTEVKKADAFCASNPAFADCYTRPITRLITEKDVDVRNKAISLAENALNEETPTGGKVRTKLTEPEIITIIRRARREVHGEPEEGKKEERKSKSPGKPVPAPVPDPTPVQPSLAAQQAGAIPPEPPVHRPPPCLGGAGCDQKPSRFVVDKVRGGVCSVVGRPVNQLTDNTCPFDQNTAQAAPVDTGFHQAGTGKADIIPPRSVPSQSRYPDSETKICEALLDFVVHEIEAEATRELAKKEFDGDLPQTIREIFIRTFAGGA